MFNKITIDNDMLAFIKSRNIKAYPCGRRRSELINKEDFNDSYYIPFDPEARLNTEANNRKYSSLNGYTTTYLKSLSGITDKNPSLVLAIAGYLFDIDLTDLVEEAKNKEVSLQDVFCNKITNVLNTELSESCCIYANIRLEETGLFSGFKNYDTSILRNQTPTPTALATLDLFQQTYTDNIDVDDSNNYYFSGLSFSTVPLADEANASNSGFEAEHTYVKNSNNTDTVKELLIYNADNKLVQRVISLCILDIVDRSINTEDRTASWQIHQQALLPVIEHGDVENSIVAGNVFVNNLYQGSNKTSTPGLTIEKIVEATDEVSGEEITKYRLRFSFVNDYIPETAE